MHFLSYLVIRLVLALVCLPFAWAFFYLANFQRTIVVVGRKLAPGDEVLLPDDLRCAITPEWLSRVNVAVLVFLGVIIVSAAISVGLASAIGLVFILLLLSFQEFSWSPAIRWIPKPGSGQLVGRIRDELDRKRERFLAAGDAANADEMARLRTKLDSLRDATGAIADWREIDVA